VEQTRVLWSSVEWSGVGRSRVVWCREVQSRVLKEWGEPTGTEYIVVINDYTAVMSSLASGSAAINVKTTYTSVKQSDCD
jgi:hypothetical protein